jgi:hypothetical protein
MRATSEKNLPPGHEHRWATHLHFLNIPAFAFHLEIDPARPMNKVALLDDKSISSVFWFQSQTAVMNQVRAECAAGAPGCRIFGDVVSGRKEPRVGA